MTLEQLIQQYRVMANDKVEPYFICDEEVAAFLNEAEREACIRGRLLLEAGDDEYTEIDTYADEATYQVHCGIYEVVSIFYSERHYMAELPLRSLESMDREFGSSWRKDKGKPKYAVISGNNLRLSPIPTSDGAITINGYRLPREPMDLDYCDEVEPEINSAHHGKLIYWALHRAFSIPDAEFFDEEKSKESLSEFTQYFGLPVDSDLRGDTRYNEPQNVKAFWV